MFEVPRRSSRRDSKSTDGPGTSSYWRRRIRSSSTSTTWRITAGPDVAFVSARMHCEPTEAGKRGRLDFRLTVGLRKDAGGWVVTHEHHSVPAT